MPFGTLRRVLGRNASLPLVVQLFDLLLIQRMFAITLLSLPL